MLGSHGSYSTPGCHWERTRLLALGEGEGAASLNYGMFIDTVINFLIVAFAVFMLIKGMNSLKKKEEAKPAEPPKPSAQEQLLTEIRDLLAKD